MTDNAHKLDQNQLNIPQGLLVGVGVVSALMAAFGAWKWPAAFWAGYLVAAVFWMGTSLGILGTTLLHRTTGGRWGYAIGRPLHAGMATLIVGIAAMSLMAFGVDLVFPWGSHAEATDVGHHVLNDHQRAYLAPSFVALRFVLFGIFWVASGFWLVRQYRREVQDSSRTVSPRLAAIGLLTFFMTVSFFVWDALLSLTPSWVSSIFPLLQLLGFGVTGMAVAVICRNATTDTTGENEVQLTHDLGNMLQAYNLLWVYLAFSQYLIIWSGDLPHEVEWYVNRQSVGGIATALLLVAIHFVIPFFLLLSRDIKRDRRKLSLVAGILLIAQFVDNAWTVLPSVNVSIPIAASLAAVCGILIGSIWLFVFRLRWQATPQINIQWDKHHINEKVVPSAEGTS